jgi:small subunit ribosomal protein S3
MAIERLFIGEGVKEAEVKKYLMGELKRAGLASIQIQRTPLVTRIVLHCDRPALVIGRKGSNVKAITHTIEQDFKIEKPELEIKKVEKPNLEPLIVAYRLASALERGMNSRRVGYKALQAIMRDGAKGAEITLSGKLVGKGGRARVLKMKAGYMKKCGHPSLEQVLHGETIATCKAGTIGVGVSIVPQNTHFPDEINLIKPEDFEVEEVVVAVEAEGQKPEEPVGKGSAAKKKDSAAKKEDSADKKEAPAKEALKKTDGTKGIKSTEAVKKEVPKADTKASEEKSDDSKTEDMAKAPKPISKKAEKLEENIPTKEVKEAAKPSKAKETTKEATPAKGDKK